MKELSTWAGRSSFKYSGSVADGTVIYYGVGSSFHVSISRDTYNKLLSHFSGKSVSIGTSRDTAPNESLGKWLQQNVIKTAIASYVGPILINEGYAVKDNGSYILFK